MSEAARSMAREAPLHEERSREDMARVHPGEKISPGTGREFEPRPLLGVDRQRLLWENRGVIFRAVRAGLLASFLVAFLLPERFQSTTRLMPPDQPSSGMALIAAAGGNQLGSGLGSMAGDLLGLKNSSDLFIGILQSRTVQDDLINAFNLRKVYSVPRMEDARAALGKNSNLSVDRKSGILTIEVTDHDPKRAAAMAEEYAGELNRVVVQLNTSSAHRERVFLDDRLTQVKQDLENAEKNFSEFAAKNTAFDIPEQGKAMIEAAAGLEGQWIAAQTELQGLKQVYADQNVRVRATQARVDALREQLGKNLNGPSARQGTAHSRDSLYPSLGELPALGVGYADLYRNTKVQEAVFQTLTQEFEMAKVQEAKETPSVKVLDPASVPERKSFPPRLLIVELGLLLSLASSMAWIFCKQAWDRTGPENPQKVLAQEVLHTVQARLPWMSANGAENGSASAKVWRRIPRSKGHHDRDL